MAAAPQMWLTLSFDLASSSIQPKVFDYLSSLEWVRAQANLAIIGPAWTGKSHTLIGFGIAAIHAGHKVRYFTAADLVETLYRGLADNTVGTAALSRSDDATAASRIDRMLCTGTPIKNRTEVSS